MITWELLHDLRESERDQTVIKIKVKGHDKPIVAAVDRVTNSEVILKPFTLFGERLLNTIIKLDHIERLVKFHLRYQQGIFPNLQRGRAAVPAGYSQPEKKKLPVKKNTRKRAA